MSLLFTILQVLAGLAVTAIVLMQSGKSAGLSHQTMPVCPNKTLYNSIETML